MTFTIRIRGASTQPITLDFLCPNCGPCIATVDDRDCDGIPCPDNCGNIAERVISAPFVGAVKASVVRGPVSRPDSPMYLNTRKLGEGQSLSEFKAERRKLYEERRHKEGKDFFK